MKLLQGDCLEVLRTLPDSSVDSLVTDPPAGISFMGKSWDCDKGGRDSWIKWMAEVMAECKRVMRPGAHGLVWAIPRTSHWTATALEDAGFEVRDVITHLFGSGFPKSMDISKAIDKAAGAERIVLGKKDVGPDIRGDNFSRDDGARMMADITAAATEDAKKWEGWGTALKPASEHWILIRKPCDQKTVAANVLKHGTGAINIDASRIGSEPIVINGGGKCPAGEGNQRAGAVWNPVNKTVSGRFPANLVLSHSPYCTDTCDIECPVLGLDQQSGPCKTGDIANRSAISGFKKSNNAYGSSKGVASQFQSDAATGASRFFYVAKISSSERNAGLESHPDRSLSRSNAAQAEEARGNLRERSQVSSGMDAIQTVKNHHPTVKPKKLMAYLIRMITPPGATVLDPFMGSGSTGLAAKEQGFGFIGIEKEAEYHAIAAARIEAAKAMA